MLFTQPTNLRFKTHPEFARKLKHLQQSDPVNPKELARRLELCLVEQDAIERGETVQTKTKKIRFSSSASRTPSDPPTPQLSVLPPLSFNSDALARSLQFHKFTNNADSNNSTIASPQGAGRKVEPLPFQFPVLADEVESPLLRHSPRGEIRGSGTVKKLAPCNSTTSKNIAHRTPESRPLHNAG